MIYRVFFSFFIFVAFISSFNESHATLKQKLIGQVSPLQNIKKEDRDALVPLIEERLIVGANFRDHKLLIKDNENRDIQRFLLQQTMRKELEVATLRKQKANFAAEKLRAGLLDVIKEWQQKKEKLLDSWIEPYTRILVEMGVNVHATDAKNRIPQKLSDILTEMMLQEKPGKGIVVTEGILRNAIKKDLRNWLDPTRGLGPLPTAREVAQKNMAELRSYAQKVYQETLQAKNMHSEMLDPQSVDQMITQVVQKLDKTPLQQPPKDLIEQELSRYIKETYNPVSIGKPQ